MLKFYKKIQQDYIAAKLNKKEALWDEVEDGIVLALDRSSLYHIPVAALHIKLDEDDMSPNLHRFMDGGKFGTDHQPAEFLAITRNGLHVYRTKAGYLGLDPKLIKPFLAVKGVKTRGSEKGHHVRFYTADGIFLGIAMCNKSEEVKQCIEALR